ncbi:MAG: hypothetical protein JXA74_03265, partial [Anaerolineae bacterium]|nr:hypothetical protein [Anaerolineae bacterium]
MSSSYDKLRRILLLEREQSFRNRVVIGGLGRFLAYWAREARTEVTVQPTSVDDVLETLESYESMSFGDRSRAIGHVLELIGEGEGSQSLRHKPAPAPPAPLQSDEEMSADAPTPEQSEPFHASATPQAVPPEGDSGQAGEDALETPPPSDPDGNVAEERAAAPSERAPSLSDSVTTLKGVSTVNQRRLARLGIHTIRDMLYHLPRRYDDFGHLKTINRLELGEEVTVVGVVRAVKTQRTRSGKAIVRVTLSDGTGAIEGTWFGQPYLARRFRVGSEVVFSGKIEQYLGRLLFASPEWEPLQRDLLHTGRLVPVYPLTKGIGARWLRRLMKRTLDLWVPKIVDPLPRSIQESA